ncbi:hypothetical protein TanjilG_11063 [Lupinus angustifolius]|uniref:Uncharacterized protein n=1 Tax=Lupinus angustifolius TaxID=3871 RepID=A0A394DB97_LUPAN|nr:hypothetical protein TanjilG_11063 [Lupinus angustifolius]
MRTNNVQRKCDQEENVEDDDEELSLGDLPITLINMTTQDQLRKEDSLGDNETQEEFYFLISKEQEMCAADDVFFQGQILPLSSKACLLAKYNDDKGNHQLNHSDLIRFKSLDISLSEIQSNSSPSKSVRSHNSSRSTSSTTTTTTPRISISNSKTKNQFYTHPSPKSQLKKAPPNQTSGGKSSSTRKYLRIGVIPTPEIRLKDLKIRSTTTTTTTKPFVARTHKKCEGQNSNNSRESVKKSNKTGHQVDNNKHHGFKKFVHKGGGLFRSGCKCSVETVRSSIVKIKGGTKNANVTESTQQHTKKEEVVELKKRKHGDK